YCRRIPMEGRLAGRWGIGSTPGRRIRGAGGLDPNSPTVSDATHAPRAAFWPKTTARAASDDHAGRAADAGRILLRRIIGRRAPLPILKPAGGLRPSLVDRQRLPYDLLRDARSELEPGGLGRPQERGALFLLALPPARALGA